MTGMRVWPSTALPSSSTNWYSTLVMSPSCTSHASSPEPGFRQRTTRAREALAVVPPLDAAGDPPQQPRARAAAVAPHHRLQLLPHGLRQDARPGAADALLVLALPPQVALEPLPPRHVLLAEVCLVAVGLRRHPHVDAPEPVDGDDLVPVLRRRRPAVPGERSAGSRG